MTFLTILYWLILILSAAGIFVPPARWPYAGSVASLILFIILGIKVLPIAMR